MTLLSPPPDSAPLADGTAVNAQPGRPLRTAVVAVVAALAGAMVATLVARPPPPPPVGPLPTLVADATGVTIDDGAPHWRYVEIAVATTSAPLPPLPAPGRIELDPRRQAGVGAPLAGRVEEIAVRVGDRVKAGDRLLSVRSGGLADIERDVRAAREAVASRSRVVERTRELVALKAVPDKELLAAEAELRDAELNLVAAQARKESLGVQAAGESLYWVRSPRAGVVIDLSVVERQEVSPERELPLARIAELDEVIVAADVQEQDARTLARGDIVDIVGQGGLSTRAVIEHIPDVVDARRRTVEVRARIDNRDRQWRPNAFVQLLAPPRAQGDVIVVPASAVVLNGEKPVVFVLESKNRITRRSVVVGRQRDGQTEILRGLERGERFVARGALLLQNQIELVD
jgi:cobalt-zinc-cadmium efflux system membrane fusion protein